MPMHGQSQMHHASLDEIAGPAKPFSCSILVRHRNPAGRHNAMPLLAVPAPDEYSYRFTALAEVKSSESSTNSLQFCYTMAAVKIVLLSLFPATNLQLRSSCAFARLSPAFLPVQNFLATRSLPRVDRDWIRRLDTLQMQTMLHTALVT